ncbi:MAG TPA: hypothetical protein VMZ04_09805 [Anaerolineae bacterium]|nr:hypothetical protein [Anaerolineae bacterium]
MNLERFSPVIISLSLLVELLCGCSVFHSSDNLKTTIIIAAPFGLTTHMTQFKAGYARPRGHIIWGNDIRDGAACKVVITNVTTAKMVFRHDFVHDSHAENQGYNYERGSIIEPDPEWGSRIGKYLLELYVDNKRISSETFSIVP